MKIGRSDSLKAIRAAHWQKMATEIGVGWPMLRERIADLSQRTLTAVQNAGLRSTSNDPATADRVAKIIEERATASLQGAG
jgi:hypothetical protein